MNSIDTIINTITNPSKAFQTLKEKPFILVILIITAVITAATSFLIMFNLDEATTKANMREQFEKRMEKIEARTGEKMTSEKMDKSIDKQWKAMSVWGKITPVIAPVMSIIFYLFLALIFFLVFKLLDTETTFQQSFSVVMHTYIPHLLKAVVAAIISFTKGGYGLQEMQNLVISNPGFLVDPEKQKVLFGLLSSLDIFNIWVIVLTIMGFSTVSGKKTGTVTAWVIGIWGFYIGVFKVAIPAILGSVFG